MVSQLKTAGVILCGLTSVSAWASKITSIDFSQKGASSLIEIHSDSPIAFDKQDNVQDKQIVLDMKDTKLAKQASRPLDTSSFDSKVSLISPYAIDQGSNARVVIQLRDSVQSSISQDGNLLRITVPNGAEAIAQPSTLAAAAATGSKTDSPTDETSGPEDVALTGSANGGTKMDQFIKSRETKRFVGKPITLQLRGADISDVFRLIGEASGFNIVLGEKVKGTVTLSLTDVPWDQALDVILHTNRLGAERNNNLLRIVTLEELTAEKSEELRAKQASDANAVRITRIFPISYANLGDLEKILQKFASSQSVGGAGSNQNVVQSDSRTNSIVIRDTPESIDRMKKLIEVLDLQTPEVQIEAKIVEVSDSYAKNLNGALGIGANDLALGFNSANPGADLVSGGAFAGGAVPNPGTNAPVGLGAGLNLGFLNPLGINRINALFAIGESEGQIKTISSPRSVVLDKEQTNIISGTPVLVQSTTTTPTGVVQSSVIQQANISLGVRPTVTNDGSVLMELNISRDTISPVGGNQSAVANRNLTTKVLVESGSTLVLGGLYVSNDTELSSGFPFLRKLPIIGALFGSSSSQISRQELMFFITPRILNTKEAGIGG